MRILSVLLFLSLHSMAQVPCNYRLSGVILESGTGNPLPGAGVQLEGSDRIVVTGNDGKFVLDSLCGGKVAIRVNYTGFAPLLWSTQLQQSVEVILRVKQSATSLNELEVVSEKTEILETVISDTLSREEMDRAKGRTLADYLKQMAGVSTLSTGTTSIKPVIHGMHSQRILILNAGVRQEGQQWGTEHAPEIDPFIANRMKVIKGASAILYGADAVGGVVIIEPKELPHEPGINAEVNLAAMSNGRQGIASGMVEQHLGKFYDLCWRLQGTAKRGGNVLTPDVYLDNTGYSEYDWSAGLGMERKGWGTELFYSSFRTTLGIFTGSHIGNLTDLERILATGETRTSNEFTYAIGNPKQEVQHQLFSLKSWLAVKGVGKLNLQYGYQFNHRYEYDLHKPYDDSLAALNLPDMELRLYTQTLDLNLVTDDFHGIVATIGINGLVQDNQYGGLRYFVPNYKLYNGGAYTLLRYSTGRWELEAGGRLDFRTQTVYRNESGSIIETPYHFTNPAISAGAVFKKSEHLRFTLNAGTAFRPPSINEWFSDGLHHGTATYETGDSTLGVERAATVNAGVNYQSEKISVELSLYYTGFSNYIYLRPDQEPVLTLSGAFPSYSYAAVDARFKGVDLSFEWDILPRLDLRSRNSVVLAWNESDNRYLELIPAPRFDQLVSYSFKDANHWKNIKAGVSILAVLEQQRYTEGTDYIPPPPAYILPGIECSGEWVVQKQVIRLGLSVNNLFNTNYRDYMNRMRYYADETGTNVVLRATVPLNFRTADHDHKH
jgi:iron complex outermembrane receptor protein